MNEFPKSLPRTPVLGVPVTRAELGEVTAWVLESARRRLPAKVAVAPVHNLVVAHQDPEHREALRGCQIVTADGQPVRWTVNLFRDAETPPLRERVYGPDLTRVLCESAAREGMAVYFFGSTPAVMEKLLARLRAMIPKLSASGHCPGLVNFSGAPAEVYDPAEDLEKIRSSGAQILFVGLGCPKQERWMHLYAQRVGIPCLGVGAAFDFHAGTLAQAPVWMQKIGLEWFFRLVMEPRRLWRRYLIGNSLFIALVAREILRRRKE